MTTLKFRAATLCFPVIWALLAPSPVAAKAAAASTIAIAAAPLPVVDQVIEKADAYLQTQVRNDMFSGTALIARDFSGTALIARDGEPVFVKSYGMANYELGAPNKPDTTYLFGSVIKQFTAVAILQLQEQGKLKVGDPICCYLENCPQSALAPPRMGVVCGALHDGAVHGVNRSGARAFPCPA